MGNGRYGSGPSTRDRGGHSCCQSEAGHACCQSEAGHACRQSTSVRTGGPRGQRRWFLPAVRRNESDSAWESGDICQWAGEPEAVGNCILRARGRDGAGPPGRAGEGSRGGEPDASWTLSCCNVSRETGFRPTWTGTAIGRVRSAIWPFHVKHARGGSRRKHCPPEGAHRLQEQPGDPAAQHGWQSTQNRNGRASVHGIAATLPQHPPAGVHSHGSPQRGREGTRQGSEDGERPEDGERSEYGEGSEYGERSEDGKRSEAEAEQR